MFLLSIKTDGPGDGLLEELDVRHAPGVDRVRRTAEMSRELLFKQGAHHASPRQGTAKSQAAQADYESHDRS